MQKSFFIKTRKNFFKKIESPSVTVLFSGRPIQRTADQEYPFEVNRNFYYLTGINQAQVILVLIKNNNLQEAHLFIEENDPVLVKWVGKKLEPVEASKISGIELENIHFLSSFDSFMFKLFNSTRSPQGTYKVLYLDLEQRELPGYTNQALEYSEVIRKKYPAVVIKNCYEDIIHLRMYKHPEEVALMRESIETTKGGIEELMRSSVPGLLEYQLEAYFNLWIKYHGNKKPSFETIVASGKNATILHYVNNDDVLKDKDLILFDLGCQTECYVSDITRTFPINGKFTKRQKEIYNVVLDVNKKCIEFLKPGITWDEYNNYAKKLLSKGCKKLGLIKEDSELSKYYYHSIGHSVGLDTHDPALYQYPIDEGMVITVEPGLYIEEEGIGIRIEDNVLITKDGCINLSKDIIKEVDEIEQFMKENNKFI